jgi:hypothetical protein
MTTASTISKKGNRRLDLAKQADAILNRAHCDTVTGAEKDRQYHRNKRAERKRLGRQWRGREKKLGKLGPASDVRTITTSTEETRKSLSRES